MWLNAYLMRSLIDTLLASCSSNGRHSIVSEEPTLRLYNRRFMWHLIGGTFTQ
jgi:hypothetical protein